MTFLQACVLAAKKATEEGKRYLVYDIGMSFIITSKYRGPNWLFRVTTDGRKGISEAGAKLAETEGVDVRAF